MLFIKIRYFLLKDLFQLEFTVVLLRRMRKVLMYRYRYIAYEINLFAKSNMQAQISRFAALPEFWHAINRSSSQVRGTTRHPRSAL